MNIHKIYGFFLPYFRKRRYRRFAATFHPGPNSTILDVGGYVWNWDSNLCEARITVLNLDVPAVAAVRGNISVVRGDGCRLPFASGSFAIGHSNSVIEHLSSWDNQVAFAREICRVATQVWVQTPARWFLIEPHLLTPFIHYLPKSWQRHLLRYFSIWGLVTKPSPRQIEELLLEIRLLTFAEMRQLFPDCEIRRERFFGLTKAYVAVRLDARPQSRNSHTQEPNP